MGLYITCGEILQQLLDNVNIMAILPLDKIKPRGANDQNHIHSMSSLRVELYPEKRQVLFGVQAGNAGACDELCGRVRGRDDGAVSDLQGQFRY